MYFNFISPNSSVALPKLLETLFYHGDDVDSRAGMTKELMHVGITLQRPWQRELLVSHRKPSIAAQIAETAWVLAGRNDVEFLSNYLPRAAQFSDDGVNWRAGYGARLRAWPVREGTETRPLDQLRFIVDTLKASPGSRQAVASIWDPQVDTQPGKDIPCNDWLSFSIRKGKLDLHVAVRSNDAIWGWSGINAFEWSALQEVVAGLVGVLVGALHFSVTSFHLYEHHWERARQIVTGIQTNDGNMWEDSPRFDGAIFHSLDELDLFLHGWFRIEEQIRNGDPSEYEVDSFPEPMLRSWLRVLQWWWTGNLKWIDPLARTRLAEAVFYSIQLPKRVAPVQVSPFLQHAIATHNEKHAAYGDSWKRRGEMLGIMANIARKIDRLGGAETSDETSADTAMDLMIYLAKYATWLDDNLARPDGPVYDISRSDTPDAANELLVEVENRMALPSSSWSWMQYQVTTTEDFLRSAFDVLETMVTAQTLDRAEQVNRMLNQAYALARVRWEASRGEDDYRGANHE